MVAWADLWWLTKLRVSRVEFERHASLIWGPPPWKITRGSVKDAKCRKHGLFSMDVPIEMWRFPTFHSGKDESPMYRLLVESHLWS